MTTSRLSLLDLPSSCRTLARANGFPGIPSWDTVGKVRSLGPLTDKPRVREEKNRRHRSLKQALGEGDQYSPFAFELARAIHQWLEQISKSTPAQSDLLVLKKPSLIMAITEQLGIDTRSGKSPQSTSVP